MLGKRTLGDLMVWLIGCSTAPAPTVTMTLKPTVVNRYFSDDQTACLLAFAAGATGSSSAIRNLGYHVLGIADLAKKEEVASLLKSLHSEEWNAAAEHCELAGENDLLVAIFLRIEVDGQAPHDHWVAMRSPFELFDSASVLTHGKIAHAPNVSLSSLPLESSTGKRV